MDGLYFNHSTESTDNTSLFVNRSSMIKYDNITHLNSTTLSPVQSSLNSMTALQDRIILVTYILYPIVLSFGVFGNIVTLVIFTFNEISSMASRYILIFLTCCDTTMLITQVFNKNGVKALLGTDVRALSLVGCKIFFHLYRATKMMSSWLVVLLCLERFLAVVFPLKVKVIITKKRTLSLLAIIFAFVMMFNGIWTFSVTVKESKKGPACHQNVRTSSDPTTYNVFLMLYNAMFSWVPICVMSVLTPFIIHTLVKQNRKRNTTLRANLGGTETLLISCMLVGVIIAYIIFIVPVTLLFINNSYINLGLKKNTPEFLIVKEVIQYLEMMNYSTNFLMYTFCSATYRMRVKQLFCGRRRLHARACLTSSNSLSSEQVSIANISLRTHSSTSVA